MWKLVVIAIALSTTPAVAQESDLAALQKIEWVEENRAELEALMGDRENATLVMVAITGEDIVIPIVGEYLFVDLDGDKRLELAASIDFSGRAFYTTVAVVYQRGTNLNFQFLGGNGGNTTNFPETIVDLDGDGDLEILIPKPLEAYQGAEPRAIFTEVYSWNGKQYTVAHPVEYEGFYRNRYLPEIERNREAVLNVTRPVPMGSVPKWIRKFELEKAEAFRVLSKAKFQRLRRGHKP